NAKTESNVPSLQLIPRSFVELRSWSLTSFPGLISLGRLAKNCGELPAEGSFRAISDLFKGLSHGPALSVCQQMGCTLDPPTSEVFHRGAPRECVKQGCEARAGHSRYFGKPCNCPVLLRREVDLVQHAPYSLVLQCSKPTG